MQRTQVSSGSPYEQSIGFSRAVRVGDLVSVSGTAPVWPDGTVDPDPAAQARRCLEIALGALAELGGRPEDVVRTRQYVVSADVAEAVGAVHGEVFGDIRPASTMVVVAGLLDPRWVYELELDAVVAAAPR
ncbi:RidA family protein [Nocardioides sp. GXZ039]|uniref:RidA family protein n=1 Tax=Nocardioides sp. GXZ039 TaxID=3136018 RepID=UPI0030F3F0CA